MIVKQGREATFLGFILKGRLIAYETREDPRLGKTVTEIHQYFEPGDTFGEISLLYNIPRLYTIVTESKYCTPHNDNSTVVLIQSKNRKTYVMCESNLYNTSSASPKLC